MNPFIVVSVLVSAVIIALRLRDQSPIGPAFILTAFALGALSGALAALTG